MISKKISIIGMGYIGLPTAAMFASKGKEVIGIDINKETVELINKGRIHIVEPDLATAVKDAVSNGLLVASVEYLPADVFIIAVPTPFKNDINDEIPKPNLSFIKSAAKGLSKVLKKGDLVILESTSPVGTTEKLSIWLSDQCPQFSFPHQDNKNPDISIAYCPERVLPGNILKELVTNDRIIGGMTVICSSKAKNIYNLFVEGECHITDSRTAELTKLTENSSRDVQIAFANELSIICNELEINVWDLISLANKHPRVNILKPGPGVGGHCIAVDPWFIVSSAPKSSQLISCARRVNDMKPQFILNQIEIEINSFLKMNLDKQINEIKISLFGLTFKPDIDDLRESPALSIAIEMDRRYPGQVVAVEPNISKLPESYNLSMSLKSYNEAFESGDIRILLVGHTAFLNLPKPSINFVDCIGFWT